MGGGLMQLVAYGAQDVYLTGNPQITFLEGDLPSATLTLLWNLLSKLSTVRPISADVSNLYHLASNGDLSLPHIPYR